MEPKVHSHCQERQGCTGVQTRVPLRPWPCSVPPLLLIGWSPMETRQRESLCRALYGHSTVILTEYDLQARFYLHFTEGEETEAQGG